MSKMYVLNQSDYAFIYSFTHTIYILDIVPNAVTKW